VTGSARLYPASAALYLRKLGPDPIRTGGKIVEIDVVADPSRLRRLDLPILDD
jgi:hypothetical protein